MPDSGISKSNFDCQVGKLRFQWMEIPSGIPPDSWKRIYKDYLKFGIWTSDFQDVAMEFWSMRSHRRITVSNSGGVPKLFFEDLFEILQKFLSLQNLLKSSKIWIHIFTETLDLQQRPQEAKPLSKYLSLVIWPNRPAPGSGELSDSDFISQSPF